MEYIFSLNLIILSLDHLVTGGLALFFPRLAVKAYVKIFGATIPPTKEYITILKPWGALGVFAGMIGLLPVYDSERYVGILWSLIVLLGMRLFYRLKFQPETKDYLNLSKGRNLKHVLLIFLCVSIIAFQIYTI